MPSTQFLQSVLVYGIHPCPRHIKEVVKDIWTMFLAGSDHCWDSGTVNDEVAEAAIGGGDKLIEGHCRNTFQLN